MKELDLYISRRRVESPRVREACRGIVVREGLLLLSYERNTDQWFLPGGGMEPGESREECCVRELAEETGFAVRPLAQLLTIREHCGQWRYITHYFPCEVTGLTPRSLTAEEAENGLEPRWLPVGEAVSIFSRFADYAGEPMKLGSYRRETAALSVYLGRELDAF